VTRELTVHAEVFNSRRDHLRAQKAWKLLAAGVRTPLGSLHRFPTAGPPKPHPALSTSGWGEATEGPPSYCWTGAPQSLATPLPQSRLSITTTVGYLLENGN